MFILEEITDSWKVGNGIIDSGSASSPAYGRVDVIFKPREEAFYRTTLTIVSSDNEVTETDPEGRGIWRVVLRGIGRDPAG